MAIVGTKTIEYEVGLTEAYGRDTVAYVPGVTIAHGNGDTIEYVQGDTFVALNPFCISSTAITDENGVYLTDASGHILIEG